ncbi:MULTISPECIES: glutamine--fructose-6-phosphate transaminase (isomerizing) [Anaerococcus]|uniref:Glutamine--fructose-6-phosphate aminotransferase [isomerizing] n=1 Tax=Anaerococcus octavius TaxID=54007 RepID=A0A380WSC6_9FIRM|nr:MULTISPECIES: glutamine--fructose-6-phosphate transaminase (isomerizing) [Anaerococcus]MDU3177805.1 glutamine--fructose-6-phosphate transaminase (isomerizing) [Anaerococcus sp.]MDU5535692.1 glutamine--fructose-6-phosphate transaminase (isomerizing) [Anaerococcus sp.]SUU91927.1 Glucosamine--fructose-6-phosphate aminotransferase [isomerizing] [Anaerococcus octavius]
MCGIVAYNGSESCKKKLLEGLEQLEYRGYDSAGIALLNENSIDVIKKSGNIDALIEKANNDPSEANIGIGHTRWATHGKPTEENAHPHVNNKKDIAIVHNGIIENYQILKEDLIKDGYSFYSETDSEVIANLIDKYYEKDLSTSVKKVVDLLEGSFSLAVISSRDPETLVLVRKESPLILGIIDNGVFAASDITAILNYTRDVIYLDDEEIVTIKDGKYKIELKDKEVNKEIIHVDMSVEAASKNGYDHFMIKEIHEQPKVIEDSLIRKIKGDFINLGDTSFTKEEILSFDHIYLTACGTAFHAAEAGKISMEDALKKSVSAELASEFRYNMQFLTKDSLLIVLSQSGETADTLSVLREAKKRGAKVLAITNVVGSSIDREADKVIYCDAGPEISVASTKAYTAQLMALYLLSLDFGYKIGTYNEDYVSEIVREFKTYPALIKEYLEKDQVIDKIAEKIKDAPAVFYLGRGLDYLSAKEGALKLKEISYINSVAMPAGELKHGSIALIEEGVPIINIVTQKNLREKSLSNIKEVKARGAYTIVITQDIDKDIEQTYDICLQIPKCRDMYQAIFAVIPQQLLAYEVANKLGLDIDKPRNLAKSVTVE